ncbi:hypothetical protein ABPG72_009578 [Tetrahymena utriculariae]
MGCTSAKSAESNKQINSIVNDLINSYSSIELYIQTQRVQTFESLLKDIDDSERDEVALQHCEVNEMESIQKDLVVFKRFKVINKYKHDLVVSKFLKNIKQCLLKFQNINEINSKYFTELNEFKNTPQGMKISKKFEIKFRRLQQLILRVTYYFETEQNAQTNVSYGLFELNSTFNKRLSHHKNSQYNSEKEIEEVF